MVTPSAVVWMPSVGAQGVAQFANELGVDLAPGFVERTGATTISIVTGGAAPTGAPKAGMCAIV